MTREGKGKTKREIEGLVDFPVQNAQNCPKTAPLESRSYIGAHDAKLAEVWDILYFEC